HRQRLPVFASHAFGSWLTMGKLGAACCETHVLPLAVQVVHTSEPRISSPAWPFSVKALRSVTLSRYTHAGTSTVVPAAAASTSDCNDALQLGGLTGVPLLPPPAT